MSPGTWLGFELWRFLVPALLDTLWIGVLAAAGLAVWLGMMPASRAHARYLAGLFSMLAVLLGGALSWAVRDHLAEVTPPRDAAAPRAEFAVVEGEWAGPASAPPGGFPLRA